MFFGLQAEPSPQKSVSLWGCLSTGVLYLNIMQPKGMKNGKKNGESDMRWGEREGNSGGATEMICLRKEVG